jgi:hypothetical protein
MKNTLDALLPRLAPATVSWIVIPHEGKSDLEISIPRKLRGWRKPGAHFMVLRDNDGGDCVHLKNRLVAICEDNANGPYSVRIVCQELEAWFLGDFAAVEASGLAGGRSLAQLHRKAKFRNPDQLNNAKEELIKVVPNYKPVSGSRVIAPYLDIEQNVSNSFQVFIAGVKRLMEINNG